MNHISEYSKLAQKEYKTRNGLVGMEIHWELYKKFRFDHENKWYMHNSGSVLENETHKHQWDLNIQTFYRLTLAMPSDIYT